VGSLEFIGDDFSGGIVSGKGIAGSFVVVISLSIFRFISVVISFHFKVENFSFSILSGVDELVVE
jgi:hypothetical protein